MSVVPPAANWRRLRLIPLAFGILAMALGLWTGVTRIGLALPQPSTPLAEFHGALMISGFLGTVSALSARWRCGSGGLMPLPRLQARACFR